MGEVYCEGGHYWTRPSKRGRPPSHCEHYPQCRHMEKMAIDTKEFLVADLEAATGAVESDERKTEIVEAPKENPFLKLKRTEADIPVEAPEVEPAKPENPFLKLAKKRPAPEVKRQPEAKPLMLTQVVPRTFKLFPVLDNERHHCAGMTGLYITEIGKLNGRWAATMEFNSETFTAVLFGGWTMLAAPHDRHCLPQVAAELAARVTPLIQKEHAAEEVQSLKYLAAKVDKKTKSEKNKPKNKETENEPKEDAEHAYAGVADDPGEGSQGDGLQQ